MKDHWTPSYIWNRMREMAYRVLNPGTPWLTPEAIKFLNDWLTVEKSGIELGSGRSTIWIAKRCKRLISVESNSSWYHKINSILEKEAIINVDYNYVGISGKEEESIASYIKRLIDVSDNSLDFVLNDGEYRDAAAVLAINKVKSGGILIVDNCNWFIPSKSKSPSSIPPDGSYPTKDWEKFAIQTQNWNRKWISNGVTDTVLFFKP